MSLTRDFCSKGTLQSRLGSCSPSLHLCVPGKETGLGAPGRLPCESTLSPASSFPRSRIHQLWASYWPELTHLAILSTGSSEKCFSSGPVATCWDWSGSVSEEEGELVLGPSLAVPASHEERGNTRKNSALFTALAGVHPRGECHPHGEATRPGECCVTPYRY